MQTTRTMKPRKSPGGGSSTKKGAVAFKLKRKPAKSSYQGRATEGVEVLGIKGLLEIS